MSKNLIASIRSFFVLGAVSLGLGKARLSTRHPEPVFGGFCPEDESDGWMFERQQTDLGSETYLLEQVYSRAASGLSSLRAILSGIAHVPEFNPVAERPGEGTLVGDPLLFDDDRAVFAGFGNVVPLQDDILFSGSGFVASQRPLLQEELQRVA